MRRAYPSRDRVRGQALRPSVPPSGLAKARRSSLVDLIQPMIIKERRRMNLHRDGVINHGHESDDEQATGGAPIGLGPCPEEKSSGYRRGACAAVAP